MRYALAVALAATMAACAASGAPRTVADPSPMSAGSDDVVVLRGGERVVGRIVRVDENAVTMETGDRVRVFSRRDIVETSFAKRAQDAQALRAPADEPRSSKAPVPPSSWYPRLAASEPVTQVEVTFFESHAMARCLGSLADSVKAVPELTLFAEPGGKIVVHDTRKWGYHAHVLPGDSVLKPQEKPGLTVDIPKSGSVVEALALVSPAQEMKAVETQRTSHAIPDATYAVVRDLSAADRVLGAQPFAGGRGKDTADGTLWAFALPRNDHQCWVYLFDGGKKHGKVLEQVYAGYGEALLAPDLMIDMVAADGVTVGRVMLLPIPESVSADGPAPEPIQVLVGKDASVEVTVAVPPRQAIVLPPRAPSTRADVFLTCYEVGTTVQERLIVAHGTGPLSDAGTRVATRELTAKTATEQITIDVSSLPEQRFPAVAWLYHRRSWLWKTGGMKDIPQQGASSAVPKAPKPPKGVISNRGRLAHALPILFLGPKGGTPGAAPDLTSPVVGGMSTAMMADALAREMA